MPLKVVAISIGNPLDITLRAIEALKICQLVIGEERKETSKLLKRLGIEGKTIELLNEHTDEVALRELVNCCRDQEVVLVSDCGTPGFCDPGANLIAKLRHDGVLVTPIPGASSLMCLLSISGVQLQSFFFRGFLPADNHLRVNAVQEVMRETVPVVLMDTPYRLGKLLLELSLLDPLRKAILGMDFTLITEQVIQAPLSYLVERFSNHKAEFMLLLLPNESTTNPNINNNNNNNNNLSHRQKTTKPAGPRPPGKRPGPSQRQFRRSRR